jgi:hypothetical protein
MVQRCGEAGAQKRTKSTVSIGKDGRFLRRRGGQFYKKKYFLMQKTISYSILWFHIILNVFKKS